jgi:hypothetical protein
LLSSARAAFSLTVACGGSSHRDDNPHALISGTVGGGEVVSVTDAIGFQGIRHGQGGAQSRAGFSASNRTRRCAVTSLSQT